MFAYQSGAAMGRKHQPATGMNTDRTRDENGRLRQKRADTLVGTLEREYNVDFGARSDMHLGTLRARTGLTPINALVGKARREK
jgi:hypothetical protein